MCSIAGQEVNTTHLVMHNSPAISYHFSDENWWKGETHLGTGLFPASFVSSDLSVDPEPCELASCPLSISDLSLADVFLCMQLEWRRRRR